MTRKEIVISNREGLHILPARRIAKEAESCSSRVEILYKTNIINARSILNIVSAAIAKGSVVTLCCTGKSVEQEESDMQRMVAVFENL